tara:strand:+ start:674 stop:847 length:174 start_codon:yes stop_codon:yes gene_type:complete
LAGALGFEPRMPVPKTGALPLGYAPMAEGERFELSKELPPCRFSRPVLSTAQPPFRL